MMAFDAALGLVLEAAQVLPSEPCRIESAVGRIAAQDIKANISQPPFTASAMDGYAVRFDGPIPVGSEFRCVGEAAAGTPFTGNVAPGEAVRIFTGAVLPAGTNHVIIQEEARKDADVVILVAAQDRARNVRARGLDFLNGQTLVSRGTKMTGYDISLLAAANIADVLVVRRPKVGFFTNGDELRPPGADLKPGQIIDSIPYALSALIEDAGGVAINLGRQPDSLGAIEAMFTMPQNLDVVVPVGGASVGDHDYVKQAFENAQGKIVFNKVAVKPGKPVWFGSHDRGFVLGLPGNPTSALVTAINFLQPLVRRMSGQVEMDGSHQMRAVLAHALTRGGSRVEFIRAYAWLDGRGHLQVKPEARSDSSLLSTFRHVNALIRRDIKAKPERSGAHVVISLLSQIGTKPR